MEQLTVIFLGPQGSGKGTQVDLLSTHLKQMDTRPVGVFSMGKTLRDFCAKEGYSQKLVRNSLEHGEMQPDFLVTTLLGNFLTEHVVGSQHLITDGFPRTITQAKDFDSITACYGLTRPKVVYLRLDENTSVERLTKRGREDDNEAAIRHRLNWYREQVVPALQYFRESPLYEVCEIDGNQSIEKVHADIVAALTQ